MTNKLVVFIIAIIFWSVFPTIIQLMGDDKYIPFDIVLQNIEEPGIFDYILTFFQMIGNFFILAFLYIPGAGYVLNLVVWILRLVFYVALYLMLRGD